MYTINIENAQQKIVDGFLFHWTQPQSDAPYLFFIHGGYHGAWCYENYYDYFYGQGYNIAAVDFPNRAGLPAGDDFLELTVASVEKIITKALNSIDCIENFVVFGHSLGALSAGQLAAGSPHVRGLVLLAPSPPGQLEGVRKIPLIDGTKPSYMDDYDRAKQRFWRHIDDDTLLQNMFAKLVGETPSVINQRYGLSAHIPWTPSQCPALVIEAELEDPNRHPPMQDKKVAEFYQADYIFMENMGHCMMVGTHWQKSAHHIEEWLQKNHLCPPSCSQT